MVIVSIPSIGSLILRAVDFRAIQAALEFPDAEVIAADIQKLPEGRYVIVASFSICAERCCRPLPTNIRYLQMDLRQPFPLEHASFDVVHARFVLMHVRTTVHILYAPDASP